MNLTHPNRSNLSPDDFARTSSRRQGRSHGQITRLPLIPHELLIESNVVLGEHRAHLGLKVMPLMIRRLRLDVLHQRCSITQPNGEGGISLLPAKALELRPFANDPLRRRALHPLHQMLHRFVTRNKQRDVNVVVRSANAQADILRMAEHRSQLRVQLTTQAIFEPRLALLGAEDQMHQHISHRLRHAKKYTAAPPSAKATNVHAATDVHSTTNPAPKARPIPAWGEAPCTDALQTRGLKALPIESSIQSTPARGATLHEMVRRPTANPLIEVPEDE